MELVGSSQSTFGDMVSELGLSAAMSLEAEYTLLAPMNAAFTGESCLNPEHSPSQLRWVNTPGAQNVALVNLWLDQDIYWMDHIRFYKKGYKILQQFSPHR